MPARLKLGAQAIAVAAVAALLTVLVWRLAHSSPPPKVGGPAPLFSLARLDGRGSLSLASLRGRTVVLNFWASWCDPCKREASTLEELWRRYRSRGVVVLGVDSGDATRDARRFLAAHGITYPIVVDSDAGIARDRYNLPGLPTTYVIDRRGRIVGDRIAGPISDKPYGSALHRNLEAALRS